MIKAEQGECELESASNTSERFVALLASRRRLRKDMEELGRRAVPQDFLSRLHAPIGLDIGARTPPELALAIMADVLATKYGRDVPHKPDADESSRKPGDSSP